MRDRDDRETARPNGLKIVFLATLFAATFSSCNNGVSKACGQVCDKLMSCDIPDIEDKSQCRADCDRAEGSMSGAAFDKGVSCVAKSKCSSIPKACADFVGAHFGKAGGSSTDEYDTAQ